ncbi:AAA family ATPase [Alicyclobacillus macrosporangiidus]|uniref:AAA family ATPase n=1 Tax=Alicyclobacillus macrosporangiidus TaxID=392015 RepID=UPI0034E972E4
MYHEQAELMERLRSAESGHGGVVIVSGEACAGKTTLVRQVLSRASVPSVTAHCQGGDENSPFGPGREIVQRLYLDKGWDRDTLPAPFHHQQPDGPRACPSDRAVHRPWG